MNILANILTAAWSVLVESAVYVLFGLLVAGVIKALLSPEKIARHLGRGRFLPVLKAALAGVPLPLCSCGVVPAAAALKKQGANSGATTAFLIATPESGVDSIALSAALLDPILTVVRPLAALVTAVAAGLAVNFLPAVPAPTQAEPPRSDLIASSAVPSLGRRLIAGIRSVFTELWDDLAPWFWVGLLLAGVVTALIPEAWLSSTLGGGLRSMLLMALVATPIYICASSSTPLAAALILKGVSPGAALVFLLAGPATNLASLTILVGLLGRLATAVYLAAVVGLAVAFGLAVDWLYAALGLSARALVGQAAELLPEWLKLAGALVLTGLSLPAVGRAVGARLRRHPSPPCPRTAQGET